MKIVGVSKICFRNGNFPFFQHRAGDVFRVGGQTQADGGLVGSFRVVKEFHAADHEYFHPDFHSSLNMGIHYVGEYIRRKEGKSVGKES